MTYTMQAKEVHLTDPIPTIREPVEYTISAVQMSKVNDLIVPFHELPYMTVGPETSRPWRRRTERRLYTDTPTLEREIPTASEPNGDGTVDGIDGIDDKKPNHSSETQER